MVSHDVDAIGKPPAAMSREEKTQVMRCVEAREASSVKRSAEQVAGASDLSHYTIPRLPRGDPPWRGAESCRSLMSPRSTPSANWSQPRMCACWPSSASPRTRARPPWSTPSSRTAPTASASPHSASMASAPTTSQDSPSRASRRQPSTLVATTVGSLERSPYAMGILERLPFRTPLGPVVIGRAAGGGHVEVSGPTTLTELRKTIARLRAHGAEQVIVDGAIDRLGSASPHVSDGIVLATGGMVDDSLEDVVTNTAATVDLLSTPQVAEQTRKLMAPHRERAARLVSFDARGRATDLEMGTTERCRGGRGTEGRAIGCRCAVRRRGAHAGIPRGPRARAPPRLRDSTSSCGTRRSSCCRPAVWSGFAEAASRSRSSSPCGCSP